jgi:hypothetical protein
MVSEFSFCLILMVDDAWQTRGSKRLEMPSCPVILLLGIGSSISLHDGKRISLGDMLY